LPLVQRLDQPVGIGQLFRQPAAILWLRLAHTPRAFPDNSCG
jgi:hypothetical protein